MNALSELIGCAVTRVERVHDYLQITFSNGSIMSIYNRYSYDGDVSDLEGTTLISFLEEPDEVVLRFIRGSLSIGLRSDDYAGPEAIALRRVSKETVVWN